MYACMKKKNIYIYIIFLYIYIYIYIYEYTYICIYPSPRYQQEETLLCFDLLTRPKMPFKVMHRKEVTHSVGSYERKSRGRKLADEIGRGKKDPIILS